MALIIGYEQPDGRMLCREHRSHDGNECPVWSLGPSGDGEQCAECGEWVIPPFRALCSECHDPIFIDKDGTEITGVAAEYMSNVTQQYHCSIGCAIGKTRDADAAFVLDFENNTVSLYDINGLVGHFNIDSERKNLQSVWEYYLKGNK